MIAANSRYAQSKVVVLPNQDGDDTATIVAGQQVSYSFNFVNHTVVVGDRIETLAFQFYTDATLWWRIADANPEILWWDDLAPGTVIRVPSL